jgi:hypothetical protein
LAARFDGRVSGHVPDMTIASLLMAGLMAFVLLVPTLMVAVLVSGLSRRTVGTGSVVDVGDEPVDLPVAA